MSDRQESSQSNNQPLFQNMDEQERVFAPEQVPGAIQDEQTDDPDPAVVPPTVLTTPIPTLAAPAAMTVEEESDDDNGDRNTA